MRSYIEEEEIVEDRNLLVCAACGSAISITEERNNDGLCDGCMYLDGPEDVFLMLESL